MPQCVLIVDDDPAQRRILCEAIKRLGFGTKMAEGGEQAISIMESPEKEQISLILLDLVMPNIDGHAVLAHLKKINASQPVIVQTANGSIDIAIEAMRAGASDFVVKPVSLERLEVSIKNAMKIEALTVEISRIKRKNEGTMTFENLISSGKNLSRVIELGRRAASSNIPVLIEGESGVGKEMIARAIQGESERQGKPFITVNCGAIPENLIESILFGHEKGAFTGATEKRTGKFEEANGGTLFLDEVGELPLDAQVKLLRALQEGEVDPVGAKRPVKVDFRLISATNKDMIKLVQEGKFREDLYYRLNVFPIMVPPLSQRLEDVADLANHFILRFASEEGKKITGLEPQALKLLQSYNWPGNVRQLENTIFRAVVLADTPILTVNEFPQIATHVEGFELEIPSLPETTESETPLYTGPAMIGEEEEAPQMVAMEETNTGHPPVGIRVMTDAGDIRALEAVEADMIRLALGRYRGHMTDIAKHLGIGRSTLYRKMREIGLQPKTSES
ncbi:MAG: sigma-54-dependent Fis family transcriptional regulator [Rhizobiales bacterium]|nr:sigma-54-dependent Fis family transcriptional regulator [Hyphomicrobiales bacterium]